MVEFDREREEGFAQRAEEDCRGKAVGRTEIRLMEFLVPQNSGSQTLYGMAVR